MSLLVRYTQPGESQLPTVAHVGEIPSGQPTCSIWIDGKEVTAIPGEAILRAAQRAGFNVPRSEEHTSELQSPYDLVCRLLLEKKKKKKKKEKNKKSHYKEHE